MGLEPQQEQLVPFDADIPVQARTRLWEQETTRQQRRRITETQAAPREIRFVENETAFEFQIDFASRRQCRDFTKNGEGFVLAAFKKGRAEVSEKQLTSSQLKELTAAKNIEVNKYIKQAAVKATEEAFTIPESKLMKMRWSSRCRRPQARIRR